MAEQEQAFQRWYARIAKEQGLPANPDDPSQFYDYRAAYTAGAKPDASGHWPSQFKKPGHPNEIVGGFNTRTGERVPGTPVATEAELIRLGWSPDTAARLTARYGNLINPMPSHITQQQLQSGIGNLFTLSQPKR